jgi:BirA family biotin operon repressor/biotin-[acetyl-CoA-carboxylase] ligase
MLDENRIRSSLPISGLGERFIFYHEVESTNDLAIDLANQGSPHGTVIIAEAQTAGRGQRGRRWITVPGSGLALSIILRPVRFITDDWIKYHALGALAVADALDGYGLKAEVKWPNDVLLQGKKVAGILADISWEGERVEFIVLGIGINVCQDPQLEHRDFDPPAIAIEEVLHEKIDWQELLKGILSSLGRWYLHLDQSQFVEAWLRKLAYRGEKVIVHGKDEVLQGRIKGLTTRGALIIEGDEGVQEVQNGHVQIRVLKEK